MEERIRVRIGTVLNDNRIDILSEDGRDLLHDLYRVIQQELDRAREEGIREGLEDILSEVENWKTHYLDTTKSEPSKTMQIGLVNVIRKMLSKLTTK